MEIRSSGEGWISRPTLTGSGAVSAAGAGADSSDVPLEREALVACPFSNASLNRLASNVSSERYKEGLATLFQVVLAALV